MRTFGEEQVSEAGDRSPLHFSDNAQASGKSVTPLLLEPQQPGDFALFPGEFGGGVSVSHEELLGLSRRYADIYGALIARLSTRLAGHFGIAESAGGVLARRALVPLIHCFLDRMVRVGKAIGCAPGRLGVPRQKPFPAAVTIEAFENCAAASPAFNQTMVWYAGRAWHLPEIAPVPEQSMYAPQPGFKNYLFRLYPKTPWRLIKHVFLKSLALIPRSRFPVLTMANAAGAFQWHGFYSKYFSEVKTWPLNTVESDRELREGIFLDDLFEDNGLREFFSYIGLEQRLHDSALSVFREFVKNHYPSAFLEAIPQNITCATESLRKFKIKTLLSSGDGDTRSTYLLAAAKQMGFYIVKIQHGSHYGYIKDMSSFLEIEFSSADQFITWGWSRLPEHPGIGRLKVRALPSPWLSERQRYWAGQKFGGKKDYDLLLMPDVVKRFPPAPHGASITSIDHVPAIAGLLKKLVDQATKKEVRILHKPYNPTSVHLLANTMQELKKIGGENYCRIQQLDKGLTHELVERCHMVLWDQPGTGFLECLTAGIPTLLLWPRISYQEEEWTKPLFASMEKMGIIHRDIDTLLDVLMQFKKSPHSWMNDPERVVLIDRFCREFAWTSNDWPKHWRQYLDGLSDHNGVANEQ